jgi:hypothetical protein
MTQATLQTREDFHWYGHHRERIVPVWRIEFDDAARSWVYIDPASGQVAGSNDRSSRLRRWLFNAAHSLDFPWLIQYRPAWDIVVWLLSIVGTVASASGVVIGWRRLRRKPGRRPCRQRSARSSVHDRGLREPAHPPTINFRTAVHYRRCSMHIEPGLVDGSKIFLSYATAAAALAYTGKVAFDTVMKDGPPPWRCARPLPWRWCSASSKCCRITPWACPRCT